jgi:hypothetical protein
MSHNTETPSIDGDTLDAVATELKERHTARIEGELSSAAKQAITSGDLADQITGEDAEANPKTREAMKVLMRERGLPIVGNHNGNWIPVSEDAVDDKLADLDARIAGIEERKDLLAENWAAWTDDDTDGQPTTDGGSITVVQAVRECIGQGTVARDTVVERVADRTDAPAREIADRLDELEREGFVYQTDAGLRLP